MQNFVSFDDFKKSTFGKNSNAKVFDTNQNIQTVNPSSDSLKTNADSFELQEKLNVAKKQNGLIEKLADKFKSVTGFGMSSKKIEEEINNNVSKEVAEKDIKKYRSQQENTAQTVGDIASCGASLTVFYAMKQYLQKLFAKHYVLNKETISTIAEDISADMKNAGQKKLPFDDFIKNADKKTYLFILIPTLIAGIVGGFVKKNLLKLNRIGTSQYKPEIKSEMDDSEIKEAKKAAKKSKKSANRRNKWSGRINGLLAPVTMLAGGYGSVLYVALNSLNRYFIGTREDIGNKNISSYIEFLKSSPITNSVGGLAIFLPAFLKGKSNKIFETNLSKAVEKLKASKLKPLDSYKTTYSQLEDIMFSDVEVEKILNDSSLSVSQKIDKLTECNIFAVKFKQINAANDKLTEALKSECPPSRTVEQAQRILVEKGLSNYTIVGNKPLGVGTIAETYLAKTESGEEVCIKMLKEGITREKIQADLESFIEMIQSKQDISDAKKEFLIKNAKSIAEGVLQEVDFNNEMAAAKELAKVTKVANVVKPIEVKSNIYVMEKAKGVNLADFSLYMKGDNYYGKHSLDELQKHIKAISDSVSRISDDIKYYYANIEKYNELTKQYPELSNVRYNAEDILRDYHDKDAAIDMCEKMNNILSTYAYAIKKELVELKGIEALKYKLESKTAELRELNKYFELRQDKNFASIDSDLVKKMLLGYQDVLVEQFNKVEANGRVIHGDIHPGNIFIDLEALKKGDKKFFTLIDTGNTIKQNPDAAMRFLSLSKYIENADTESIVDFVLDGAKLPEGLTKEQARTKVLERLNTIFFDDKTELDEVTTSSLLGITDGIMQELKIIPAETQGQLIKAKRSANRSMLKFLGTFFEQKSQDMMENIDIDSENLKIINKRKILSLYRDMIKSVRAYPKKQKLQEKRNLLLPNAKIISAGSKNIPNKNSEEYLTYYLKQGYSKADKLNTAENIGEELSKILARLIGLSPDEVTPQN